MNNNKYELTTNFVEIRGTGWFEYTFNALERCCESFGDELKGSEKNFRAALLELCKDIVKEYGEETEVNQKRPLL